MLDLKEFKILDRNSVFYGTPISKLMDNAGRGVAEAVMKHSNGRSHVLIVCGPGNNGGDGSAAARYLRGRIETSILLAEPGQEPKSDLLRHNFSSVSDLVVGEDALRKLDWNATVVVDALLGSGINRRPEGRYRQLIDFMHEMKRKGSLLLSVDVPSGFPTDFHVLPDITVTFHDTKAGMIEENSGKIEIVDIGIPEKAIKYTGPGEMLLYPVPANDTHKGNNGIITVIGGGAFAGAPTFASLAAYRTGADLVYTVVPKKSFGVASVFSPNMMVFSTAHQAFEPADEAVAMKWVERSGSLVIGPGMDSDSKTHGFIRRIMKKARCSMVVDASAIEVAGDNSSLIAGKNVVVTPHSKEFEKLTGEVVAKTIVARSEQIRSWAHKLDVTILLKGATDVISDGRRVKLNDTGNPGMTVGGTGDVLTGIAAELMAKGCSPFDAGRLAAYINGSSGDICFRSKSFGLLATDVIESIPDVLVRDLGGNQ